MLDRESRGAHGGRGGGLRLLHKLCTIVRTRMLRLGEKWLTMLRAKTLRTARVSDVSEARSPRALVLGGRISVDR